MRLGHIHFTVNAPGHRELITQIFDRRDEYIHNDTVFAVKEALIDNFIPRKDENAIHRVADDCPRTDNMSWSTILL